MKRRVQLTLWLTVGLQMVAFGIILPVLPFYALRFGASAFEVALLAGTFSLAQLLAAPALGRLGDRIGRRPVLLGSVAGATAAMLVLSLADALWVLFVARLLAGSCSATMAVARSYVADVAPPGERAGHLARLGAAAGLGFVLGPALGGLLSTADLPTLPFFVATALGVLNGLVGRAWLPHSRAPRCASPAAASHEAETAVCSRPRSRRHRLAPPIGTLVALNFVLLFGFAGMEATFALLLERRLGWGASQTAVMLVLIGATVVVTQGLVTARVVGRIGERSTMLVGMGLLGLGLAGIGSASGPLTIALGGVAVAIGNSLVSPSLHALVSRASSADVQGFTLGLCASAGSLGRVLGPATAGVAFEGLGPGAPPWIGAALVWAGAGWWWRASAGSARVRVSRS